TTLRTLTQHSGRRSRGPCSGDLPASASTLHTPAGTLANLLSQSSAHFVVNGRRCLFGRLNGDHERVADGLASTEPLGIVHAFDVDGQRVAVAENHRSSPLHNLVLETPPPDRVVLCVSSVATSEVGVGCREVDLGTS